MLQIHYFKYFLNIVLIVMFYVHKSKTTIDSICCLRLQKGNTESGPLDCELWTWNYAKELTCLLGY